jgi:hypothetical protein
LVLIALGAVLAALPAVAFGSASHAASNSQTFPDSTGEDSTGASPDVTSVAVSNDDAGNITLKVNIANRPALTSDMAVIVYLNTDQNASTGDPNLLGTDAIIQLFGGNALLFQWNGSTFAVAQSQSSLVFSYDATGATFHVSDADLGRIKSFGFIVEVDSNIGTDATGNPDFTTAKTDIAPDPGHGFFAYDVITKLSLHQTAFTTAPSPAKAGARFAASLAATESDTNGPIKGATITCTGVVHGVKLRATHSLANGIASCFWKLPKTAKGRSLYGQITVVVQGTKLTKSFVAKIH